MTLARLEQLTTALVLALGLTWLAAFWSTSKPLAFSGFVLFVLGYSAVLAIEFVAVKYINRAEPVPQPGWAAVLRAWASECIVAPQVFCWRQPFFSEAEPDHLDGPALVPGRCGVVLIHGFVCNRGLWTPWLRQLRANGHAFVAVNLEPVFGSIDDYGPLIDRAVAQVQAATGRPPVLLCHSMGGLAARSWLARLGSHASQRVQHVITIGTPHGGTWLGRFSHVKNGREMCLGSEWIKALAPSSSDSPPFTCWYSNCDNIVFPATTATLAGADNRLVEGAAHVQLAFHPKVMGESLAQIQAL